MKSKKGNSLSKPPYCVVFVWYVRAPLGCCQTYTNKPCANISLPANAGLQGIPVERKCPKMGILSHFGSAPF
jgi:hypothetical protein